MISCVKSSNMLSRLIQKYKGSLKMSWFKQNIQTKHLLTITSASWISINTSQHTVTGYLVTLSIATERTFFIAKFTVKPRDAIYNRISQNLTSYCVKMYYYYWYLMTSFFSKLDHKYMVPSVTWTIVVNVMKMLSSVA